MVAQGGRESSAALEPCAAADRHYFVVRTASRMLMLKLIAAIVIILLGSLPALAQERVGEVSTTFRVVGPNDKVVIERYDDPKVENASCYVSRAETGGLSGWVGLAEDPSRFSIACRATGPVKIIGEINRTKKGEVVFSENTSILFKEMRVSRFYDADKNVLIYLVWSTKLIDGSPYNSVTAIPVTE
jgi:CreA protein